MADEVAIEFVPGAGDVSIELHGLGKVALKPSLQACLILSRTGDDGPRRVADRVLALNIDAIAMVVAAGLGKGPDDVLEAVYLTGAVNIFGDCLRFLHIVSNGGRPPKKREDTEKAGDPPPSS